MKVLFILAIMFVVPVLVPAQKMREHPATYLDKGACPFECCTYRRWNTLKDTVAYALPDKRSKRMGTFKKGTWVRGLTGEVRTLTPGKFVVTKPHEKYRPGNILWTYSSVGEGFYKVWFRGRMFEENMYPLGWTIPDQGPTCAETRDCWGELVVPLKTVWWVKVRSPAGWIGWTDQTNNFGNMDQCG